MPGEIVDRQADQAPAALAPAPAAAVTEVPPAPSASPGLATRTFAEEGLVCANCATPLTGPYCARCGQHVADFHRSLRRLLAELFDNVFCWDNKWLHTLGPLLTRPGFLTQEFMLGRRVRYVLPLRLFLFTSAVCLTLLQFEYNHSGSGRAARRTSRQTKAHSAHASQPSPTHATPRADDDDDDKDATPAASAAPSPAGSPTDAAGNSFPFGAGGAPGSPSQTGQPDAGSLEKQILQAGGDARVAKTMGEILDKRIEAAGGEKQFAQHIADGFERNVSWTALAVLPLFALVLRSVYWREDSFYFTHLIFSLHYHTALLLFWTAHAYLGVLENVLGFFPLGLAMLLSWLLPPVYLYVALRRMFGEEPRRTWFKVILVGTVHAILLVGALAIAGVLSVMKA